MANFNAEKNPDVRVAIKIILSKDVDRAVEFEATRLDVTKSALIQQAIVKHLRLGAGETSHK